MSVRKRAVVILAVALMYAVYRAISGGIDSTGSGGLGAVSFGVSEALIEGALLAIVIAAFLYSRSWWRRRRAQ